MILVVLLYILFASTFTLGKAALDYIQPILFVGIRMTLGGLLLLGYQYFFNYTKWRYHKKDRGLLLQIIIFHIYVAYVLEFWALQWMTSAKACLLYNLSPFITAILSYFLIAHRLTIKQFIGLLIGFVGFLPILMATAPLEGVTRNFAFVSVPEVMLVLSVVASAYGWMVMRKLTVERRYSAIMINGIGMLGGGILAFITSLTVEGLPTIKPIIIDKSALGLRVELASLLGPFGASLIMLSIYTVLLVLIANIIGYNLYSMLLKRYTPTFLSFAGFLTPLFAALFGWALLNESITWYFFATIGMVFFGLYVFYQDEL